MKKILLTLAFVIPCTFLFSQDWVLEFYKSGNTNFLRSQISKKVDQGYLPVGIEVAPDPNGQVVSLYVLYINDQTLGITAWQLETYNSDPEIERGIKTMDQKGFTPKEIAFYDGIYYVMFLKFPNAATAWTIQNAEYSNQGLLSTINNYNTQGYVPFGMTLNRGNLNLLFIKIPLNSLSTWKVEVYDGLQNMKQGITQKYGQGWSPWAILIDGNKYIIMFLTS